MKNSKNKAMKKVKVTIKLTGKKIKGKKDHICKNKQERCSDLQTWQKTNQENQGKIHNNLQRQQLLQQSNQKRNN